MIDRAAAFLLLLALPVLMAAYGARTWRRGAPRFARVERDKGSVLLGLRTMHMGYWALQPVAAACVRAGLSAAAVTWGSLFFGALAAVSVACGHFGIGALLACAAALGDSLDGMVARRTGTASEAGELLDASADRYSESFVLSGIAFAFRERPPLLLLTLAAIAGSWMVSYATAKAEALRVEAPRGTMRRPERALCLVAGAALTAWLAPYLARLDPSGAFECAPLVLALVTVAGMANATALHRLSAMTRALRDRGRATALGEDCEPAKEPAA